uniref:VWFA domain-containing protein n=1 Tax=Parastrongyloides trichosuri TaxID=131310 RepID=A0A0N5A0M0_PARTI
MKFNYSIILTFALVGIYSSLLTGKAISDTIVQQQLSTEVKCDEYFGLFFVDKSISGNNNIHSQINIINYFFNNNKKFSGNAFTSIVSQADKIIDNNYAVVGPSDFVNLRHQINNVVQESAGGENVSYYKLASGVRVNMNFNDHSKFPNNSAIIMFVDSHIAESSETKAILEEIRSSNPSVKTLALIYDDKYMNDAISLVGNEILVHKADDSSIDNLSKTIGWLIDNMCNSKLNNNAPTSNDGFFCNIAIGMETSSDILTSDLYIKERDVIANSLPTIIPDIERVAFAAFDREIHDIHYFGSFQSKDQFSNIVESVSSGSGSNIETIMEQFTYMTPPDCGKMSSFIFISENITGDIVKAQQYANILKNMGSLNFIILGTDLKPSDLAVFNPTSIYSFDFGNCDIDALLNYIQSALTCSTNGCVQPSPTPQPSCSGTTCNVAIAMDTSSDKLSPYYYQSEQSVLGENIVNILPDISQVALVGYDANVEQFYGPGSITSKTMFSYYVNQYQQNPGSSLSGILKRLTQLPQNGDEKLSTFVFISELNTADSQNVQYYAQILKNRGSLNFVIIGIDVHPSDLYSFTNPQNIFKYEPGDCDIQDLLNFFTSNIICSTGICSSTTTTTTTQSPCTTGTECNIVIAMDTSSDKLQQGDFQNEQNIVANYISGAINDFSRVMLMGYDTNVEQIYSFGSMYNKNSFVNNVNTYTQRPGSSLSKLFASLLSVPVPYNEKLSIYIFISEYNANEIQLSQYYAQQLKSRATINFIIIGNDVFPNYLLGLTNSENVFVYTLEDCDINLLVNFFTKNLDCYKESCISPTLPPITIPFTIPISTTTPKPDCLCYETVHNVQLAIDVSYDKIPTTLFGIEKEILNKISNIIPDFKQFAYLSYAENVQAFNNFNDFTTQYAYNNFVNSLTQTNGSRLSLAMKSLTQTTAPNSGVVTTYVMLSELSITEIEASVEYARILNSRGPINYIIFGDDILPSDIAHLYPTNIFTVTLGECDIDNLIIDIEKTIQSSEVCYNDPKKCQIITTTIKPQCEKKFIFAIDSSTQFLDSDEFNYQKKILSQNVTTQIVSDYKNVALINYDVNPYIDNYFFGNINDWTSFNNDINSITQGGSQLNLDKLLQALTNEQLPEPNLTIFIFISQKLNNLQNSIVNAEKLLSIGT